jgi:ATP-binding cassette subfamily B protein
MFSRVCASIALVMRAAPFPLLGYGALTLGTGALPVVAAWLTRSLLDDLVRGASWGTLSVLGAGLSAAAGVAAIAPQATQYLRGQMERSAGLLALDRLFAAVDGFIGLGRFEDPRFIDRLRLAQQSGRSGPGQVVTGTFGLASGLVTAAGFVGSLFAFSPLMATVVLVAGIPALIAEGLLSRRRARMVMDVGPVERREFFYSQLLSTVEGAKEIRLFGLGAFFRQRMRRERIAGNAERRAMDRRELTAQCGLEALAAAVSSFGLLWAIDAAHHGRLSLGEIAMFIAAVSGVQSAMAAFAGYLASTSQALILFDHYLAVTQAGSDLPKVAQPRPLPALRRGIELRDVWFRYSEHHPWALRGVDLHIPPGRALALVGLNGAGKSTLVKLLCRFYDPTRGAIYWDGVDLRDADPAELRARIGAVFQDYMRYELTAAENIGLGDLTAMGQRERIEEAGRRAGIHEQLNALPRGYETLLSRSFLMEPTDPEGDPELGVVLSGGQQQRLALARALLREDCELMILDEPASGLDAKAEHEIHSCLRRHRAGKTSLLISHRLGAVRDAPTIVVLQGGRVVEQGSHAALMAASGQYAAMFRLQASGYQPDPETSLPFEPLLPWAGVRTE